MKGSKILLVDDDETFLHPFEELLRELGYRVNSVGKSDRAIDEYRRDRPDIVMIDRNMPGMDGLSTSRGILSMDPDAKIILMSGYEATGANGIDDSIWSAVKGYITKPFDISCLSHVLADVIGQ